LRFQFEENANVRADVWRRLRAKPEPEHSEPRGAGRAQRSRIQFEMSSNFFENQLRKGMRVRIGGGPNSATMNFEELKGLFQISDEPPD